MEIGLSAYSFDRYIRDGKMKQLEAVKKAAELGFSAIEFAGLSLEGEETPETFAPKILEEARRVGVNTSIYAVGADFLNNGSGSWENEAERLISEVNAASLMGAFGMRHDATAGFAFSASGAKSFDDALPTLIKGCRAVTEYAQERGIRTMVENHGYFCQDSERLEKLVCGVNHPNFGLLLDMGNFIVADEDPAKAFGRLLPYAIHIHAKDFHIKPGMLQNPGRGWFLSRGGNYLRGAIIGHGDVPVSQCVRLMKTAGYKGMISIEFEGLEDPCEGISIGKENLEEYILES